MRLFRLGWLSILFLSAMASQSWASVLELDLFGYRVTILGGTSQTLSIDSKKLHENTYVGIESIAVVGGVPVAIGSSSPGGNACESAPFVISFPPGKMPRFDGPIETCFLVKAEVMADKVIFSTTPLASVDGDVWEWTPANGLRKTSQVKLTASPTKGWNELRERTIEHPANLFEYGEISAQLDMLLGSDRRNFAQIIEGVGSGEFKNDTYIGRTCARHMCGTTEAIVIADIPTKQVFLAWKEEDKPIVVRPDVKKWGEKFRSELRDWASKWK